MKKSFLSLLLFLLINSCGFLIENDNFNGFYWKLTSIEGEEVPIFDKTLLSKKNVHLIFKNNGMITGFSGCNTINGRFNREKNVTNFIGVVTTKNSCSKDKIKIEQGYINFLKSSEYMIVNKNTLTIYNKNKDIVLIFKKEETM